jgi:Fe-S-cluster formation regulator IscX/YfhJ
VVKNAAALLLQDAVEEVDPHLHVTCKRQAHMLSDTVEEVDPHLQVTCMRQAHAATETLHDDTRKSNPTKGLLIKGKSDSTQQQSRLFA